MEGAAFWFFSAGIQGLRAGWRAVLFPRTGTAFMIIYRPRAGCQFKRFFIRRFVRSPGSSCARMMAASIIRHPAISRGLAIPGRLCYTE